MVYWIMRLLLTLAITAMIALTLNAADLAGTWKGSMETQMGATEVTITIQPGAVLAGKVKAGEYEAPIENAKVDGFKIYFEMNVEPGKVTYEGAVNGDEMSSTSRGHKATNTRSSASGKSNRPQPRRPIWTAVQVPGSRPRRKRLMDRRSSARR